MMNKILTFFLIAILTGSLWTHSVAMAGEKTYTVAVVPQFASTQVYRDWTPLLARLEQATGYRFQLLVYDDFPRFESDFSKGIPDLVFLNPYHMVIARQKQGYRPLVRDSSMLSGILVVRQDSPVVKLSELNGKNVAFPSLNALGASLYLRALLAEELHIKISPVYVNGHQNVYRQVILGDVAAGGGVKRTLEKEPAAVQTQLKTIFNTPEIAPHPLAAHPRVPASAGRKIIDAMLALSKDPEGGKLLAAILMQQPVEADYRRDYSELVKLRLDRYAVTQPQ